MDPQDCVEQFVVKWRFWRQGKEDFESLPSIKEAPKKEEARVQKHVLNSELIQKVEKWLILLHE